MKRTYSTDLSEKEWACLKANLPASKLPGRLRAHSLRDIFDAIFYVLKSGCPWRLLPHDFPPWSTVYYHFRRFRLSRGWCLIYRALRCAERKRVGKNPDPSAAIMDSQSVKTTEEGARSNGYDAHKNIKGRKLWADGAYSGEELAKWCEERGGWELEIVERRSAETEGFAVLPHR